MPARIVQSIANMVAVVGLMCLTTPTVAQTAHDHTPAVSGVSQGVPYFCADPSVTSAANGGWSDPQTWSTKRVPGPGDKVRIVAGHNVVYDIVSDARLDCIEVDGHLSFRTAADTRMKVANLTVMEHGVLEVGTEARPSRRMSPPKSSLQT